MIRALIVASCLCLGISSCENKPAEKPTAEAPAASASGKSTKLYGAALGAAQKAELKTVLTKPDEFKDKSLIVEGEVRRACTRKGCWMEIAESVDKAALGARVTFKDYGFFVPLDSAGAHAKLEGTVNVETLTAANVEHLEGEGAKFASKNPDGTAREVQFVATGVELTR
jgi:hypothetical protein